jgi:hypothetical protein
MRSRRRLVACRLIRLNPGQRRCYYDGRAYSWNACHNGQRCALGHNDFYYWEDDLTCVDIQQQGGKPQI